MTRKDYVIVPSGNTIEVGQGRPMYDEVAGGRRGRTPVENLAELTSCILTWALVISGFALAGFALYKLAALI
jgi:hypothetical protein